MQYVISHHLPLSQPVDEWLKGCWDRALFNPEHEVCIFQSISNMHPVFKSSAEPGEFTPPNTVPILSYVNKVTSWQGLWWPLTHHLMIISRQWQSWHWGEGSLVSIGVFATICAILPFVLNIFARTSLVKICIVFTNWRHLAVWINSYIVLGHSLVLNIEVPCFLLLSWLRWDRFLEG